MRGNHFQIPQSFVLGKVSTTNLKQNRPKIHLFTFIDSFIQLLEKYIKQSEPWFLNIFKLKVCK